MTRRIIPYFLSLLVAISLLAQAAPSSLHLEPLTGEVTVGAGQTSNHNLVTPKVAVLAQKEFLVSWDVSRKAMNPGLFDGECFHGFVGWEG